MPPDKYVENLLVSQNLSEQQEKDLQANKKEVTDFLNALDDHDDVHRVYAAMR